MSFPRNTLDEIDDGTTSDEDAADVVSAETLVRNLARIKKYENERKVASERVTEARKAAADEGIDSQAMAFILRLSKLDQEDRERYLFRINKYAALLRFS